VQQLYNAYLDWDARDALGITPLRKAVDRISAVSTLDELTQMLGSKDFSGENFLTTDISRGVDHPDIWMIDIAPIELLLRDSAEYRERSETGELMMAAYTSIISTMLERLGYSPEETSEMVTRTFALEEELYGAIGLVIAHEISHAFDPTGSQFDADGRLNDWWTEADYDAFNVWAKKLIDYYNGITVFSGLQVPGESVQGEAVADLGGMKCMLGLLEEKKENADYRAFFES